MPTSRTYPHPQRAIVFKPDSFDGLYDSVKIKAAVLYANVIGIPKKVIHSICVHLTID